MINQRIRKRLELGTLLGGEDKGNYAHGNLAGAAPTEVECIAAFGTPATAGAGFIGLYNDDSTSGKSYLVLGNGVKYSTIQATDAV
jgi:hypothetical protein